jgi:hypothetical protein
LLWFHGTTEPWTKPLPVTVSVVAVEPAVALVCEREATAGVGFDVGVGGGEAEPPPPHAVIQQAEIPSARAMQTQLRSSRTNPARNIRPHVVLRRKVGG